MNGSTSSSHGTRSRPLRQAQPFASASSPGTASVSVPVSVPMPVLVGLLVAVLVEPLPSAVLVPTGGSPVLLSSGLVVDDPDPLPSPPLLLSPPSPGSSSNATSRNESPSSA